MSNADCYSDRLLYSHSYAQCHTDGDSYAYLDDYTYAKSDCQTQRNTEAASHAGTAAVRR